MAMSSKETGGRLKPHLWFTLYELLGLGAANGPVKVSTTELSRVVGGSQQSASMHLRLLERMGLVSRRAAADGSLIRITDDGLKLLSEVLSVLKRHLEEGGSESFVFEGSVFSGMYQGAYYMGQRGYRDQIKERLGFDPYPGTLNLRLEEGDIGQRRRLEMAPAVVLDGFRGRKRAFGGARCYPLVVNGEVDGALIVADRTSYDLTVMEVIAPINLRERFKLKDGDRVTVSILGPRRSSS